MNLIVFFTICYGISQAKAADISGFNGRCGVSDSCRTGEQLFRTCSCNSECAIYGTCCSDSKYAQKMAPLNKNQYRCNSDRIVTPVYAKRTCLDDFNIQPGHKILCEEEEHDDKADVMGNMLITGAKSKITYWNRNCALCNNEDPDDLIWWTIQVTCPSQHDDQTFTKNYVEDHLFYDKDVEEWGLKVENGFRTCTLTFAEPRKTKGKLSYCAPNLVTDCPNDYPEKKAIEKCHAYHAERRHKDDDHKYYRNAHCALCNGVQGEELECVGRRYGAVKMEKGRDSVLISFDQEWLSREGAEKYKCSWNNTWDPFHRRCRKLPIDQLEKIISRSKMPSSAHKTFSNGILTVIIMAFWLKCYQHIHL